MRARPGALGYASHPCYMCRKPSVGFRTNGRQVKFYCEPHWYITQKQIDEWMRNQERRQWRGRDWYEATQHPVRQERPQDPERPTPAPRQAKLL